MVPIDKDTVYISPADSSVTITWAVDASADNYTIKIKNMNDTSIFYSFTFNTQGQVTHIACSPNRSGGYQVSTANAEKSGFRFTISGLDPETTYYYKIDTQNASGTSIANYIGTFTTTSPAGIINVNENVNINRKLIRDGHLLIIREGKMFNAQGGEVR